MDRLIPCQQSGGERFNRRQTGEIELFYHHLWQQGQRPLDALRHAQLDLYRNPGAAGELAGARGPDFDKVVKRVTGAPARPADRPAGRAPVRHWAAFVLSGAGR